jgi:hypothetical protein
MRGPNTSSPLASLALKLLSASSHCGGEKGGEQDSERGEKGGEQDSERGKQRQGWGPGNQESPTLARSQTHAPPSPPFPPTWMGT